MNKQIEQKQKLITKLEQKNNVFLEKSKKYGIDELDDLKRIFDIIGDNERTINKLKSEIKVLEVRNVHTLLYPKVPNVEQDNQVVRKSVKANDAEVKRKYNKIVNKMNKKNEKYIMKGRPEKVKQVNEDTLNFFHKVKYSYMNIKNIRELYDAIRKEKYTLNKPINHVVIFIKIGKNQARHTSIRSDYLDEFDDFVQQITDIATGQAGSDPISVTIGEIDFNNFVLAYYDNSHGNGSADKIMFKCENISNGSCGWDTLKKCGYEHNNKNETIFLSDIIKIIESNNLKIRIVGNTFSLINWNGIEQRPITKSFKYLDKKTKRERLVNLRELKTSDCAIQEIYCSKNYLGKKHYEHTIIYDEINKHYDVALNNTMELKDETLVSSAGIVWMNDDSVFTPKQLIENNIMLKKNTVYKYVFFNYKTIIDFDESSCMKGFMLSIMVLDGDTLEKLHDADCDNDTKKINEIKETSCITFIGYDCSKQFINWILENRCNAIFCFVGFDNSNFDNFILLSALLKHKKEMAFEYSVSDIFYNGSQLMNFKMDGRHHVFDIHRHLTGSLNDNCESFKINCHKKYDIDYDKIEHMYINNTLTDYITNNHEIKNYNEHDVMSMAVLFKKYQVALSKIDATAKYAEKLSDIQTIGSLVYNVFSDHVSENKIKMPKLPYKYYTDLSKFKTAGRVEMFNGVMELFERIASTDVCSLYPFVMCVLNCYYPCGETIKDVDTYQGDDVIGFYYCDIDQSNLKSKNLPCIYPEKIANGNNWNNPSILNDYLISNVMIGLLKKHGCKVVIKKGFIFEDRIKSCELFKFLLDFMKVKNQQDIYKKTNDPLYIPALRETMKLALNSLSGKVIEKLHTEKTKAIDTIAEFEKIKHDSQSINVVNEFGGKIFITYEINAERICEKQQRPIYLGVLIYDYAKRYMYEYSYSKIGLDKLIYTDTDATKIKYNDFLVWKKWVDDINVLVPHWKEVEQYEPKYITHKIYESDSKIFGSFEDELNDMVGTNYRFYCLEKKAWLYACNSNNVWNTKMRFKGINEKALLLNLNEPFIETKFINHRAKDNKPEWMETYYCIKDGSAQDVYEYYNSNKDKYLTNDNQLDFFKQLYNTGEAYVLVQSFNKVIRNNKRNVEINETEKYNTLINEVHLNISIKHFSIKNHIPV